MTPWVKIPDRIEGLAEPDQVAWDQVGALVDQLVERVLPVGARLAPIDGSGRKFHRRAVDGHVFAVAFHR